MEAYLDNASTTRPFECVVSIMKETMDQSYGNPSSMHNKGFEAEKYVKKAKEIIAATLKAEAKEIIFTSGGTESNNMALIGSAIANRRQGRHIITTKIEHASVHNPLIFLEEQGYEVSYLSVDRNGFVDLDELEKTIREDTILVSVMYVNNEIGTCEKIEEISKIIKRKNSRTLFHVDAIQAYGKYKIYPKKSGIDLLSISGHKLHGPKGIGVLFVRDKVKIQPIIHGGGQQNNMRSGTENVPGIAGIGAAAEEIYTNHGEKVEHLYQVKEHFIEEVKKIDGVTVNGIEGIEIRETAPHVVSVSFDKIRAEVLLHALEEKGIYVSSGSACASNHPQLSGTLQAIGVKKELLDSTIRFSFSVTTTIDEIDYAVKALNELLPVLRRFTRH
ncbi:cysteine desulfurase family protein [[Clostridium] polysaccharolyticum]|uniref:cysteine desulfurase n=1 Tax=[Clostridium] polysaccharolyticum TaxID=29364 RepID=A0A1H9ZQ70_9FIRM|nr:cysteine desulfurase family protein [[Clostridium] polysaccharolyticum]SES83843.1 cysteine desulfurase [[Clostridium] polysaccharolyticum]